MDDPRYVRNLLCGKYPVQILIRRGHRKTMAIHVFPDKPVELRVPLKCAWTDIDAFLESRREWIAESLESLAGDRVPVQLRYTDGEVHRYLGRPLRLRLTEGRTRRVSVLDRFIDLRCSRPDDAGMVKQVLEAFYRTEAKQMLPGRVSLCLGRFQQPLPVQQVSIRKMRSRWGSCSNKGEICLNSLLMQKPLAAVDFVVTHELCHLKHFAHNKSFYRMMDRVMPDWRERERLLSRDDAVLQLDLF